VAAPSQRSAAVFYFPLKIFVRLFSEAPNISGVFALRKPAPKVFVSDLRCDMVFIVRQIGGEALDPVFPQDRDIPTGQNITINLLA
jgi:hypothetical protein